jgi:cell division protein FtsQ
MTVNWKQTAIVLLDIIIAIYLLLAITVFNQPEDKATVCTEVNINIANGQNHGFLSPADVKQLLEKQRQYPLAQPMQFVSTRKMEETLRKNPYIANAECYKTQSGHVCISIRQRTPILHVMAADGDNYYLDTYGSILPQSRYPSDIIIVTGVVNRKYAQKVLTRIGNELLHDKFWQNQVVQVNVVADGTLELVPRVGDHIIYLGPPVNISKKLERLRKFYLYGLNEAGWNKYATISVEFDNQIICKKKKQ